MKKKILFIMFIAASLTIAALLSGCPTNIQAGDYRLYTVSGTVIKSDGGTGIENILIEVRNQKILEKDENVVVKFSSADENLNVIYSYGRGEDEAGEQNSSGDENSLDNSDDSSSSSVDGNNNDNNEDQNSSADENSSSSSSQSSNSSSSSSDSDSSSSSSADGR